MGRLQLTGLCLGYGGKAVVKDLNLTVADGELVSLLGPSGAGKTTILKAVAGFVEPLAGTITIDKQNLAGLPAEKRDVVLVFQKPLLFPFLNVADNVGFGLRMQGMDRQLSRRRIAAILDLVGLDGFAQRRPDQLSGGQQQRVALARALVLEPAVLLLDEPLASLDPGLRQQMRELIRTAQRQTGITTILVTHDQAEALMISDRIGLLLAGGLRQTGTPTELFYQPVDTEVAQFFGNDNVLAGPVINGRLHCGSGRLLVNHDDCPLARAHIRPEHIQVGTAETTEAVAAEITAVTFTGSETWLRLASPVGPLTAISAVAGYCLGERLLIILPVERIIFFPAAGAAGDEA